MSEEFKVIDINDYVLVDGVAAVSEGSRMTALASTFGRHILESNLLAEMMLGMHEAQLAKRRINARS